MMAESKNGNDKQARVVNQDVLNNLQNAEYEKEIEIRHQYQMFPTPDETFASEAITELKD